MTPDVQWRLQTLGYNPERAAEALPTLIRICEDLVKFKANTPESDIHHTQKAAEAVLYMARSY